MSAATDPVPPADLLEHLDSDSWALLLTTVRQVIQRAGADLPAGTDHDALRELVSAPVGRLGGGRGRRRAAATIAASGWLWAEAGAVLRTHGRRPASLDWLLTRGEAAAGSVPPEVVGGPDRRSDARGRRDRDRLLQLRAERDRLTRQLAGATARSQGLSAELEQVRGQLADARATVDRLGAELAAAGEERDRAVARERRRRDAELAQLREQLAAVRRAGDQRRQQPPAAAPAPRGTARSQPPVTDTAGFRPGRPSRLPDGVVPGTTEAASWLLGPGRRVLVDGYNVTLRHRPQLELEAQRGWLLQLLAVAVARLGLRPEVVFDGDRGRGGSAHVAPGARGVRVRFTADGVSADDELVLDVEATDEPVTVVTDDRELTARVSLGGADVVGTTSFLGVVG